MKIKIILALVVTVVMFLLCSWAKMVHSSQDVDLSMNQVKTGEDSNMERSMLQTNFVPITNILGFLVVTAMWYPVCFPKNKK